MMCSCSLAGTAACRTCSINDQSFYSKIDIISKSLTQEGWLKLLKDGVELQSGESITLKAAESKPKESKLNTYDLYYGTEFFIRITAENYQYDETRDRFYFMKDGTKLANVAGYDLNIIKIN